MGHLTPFQTMSFNLFRDITELVTLHLKAFHKLA